MHAILLAWPFHKLIMFIANLGHNICRPVLSWNCWLREISWVLFGCPVTWCMTMTYKWSWTSFFFFLAGGGGVCTFFFSLFGAYIQLPKRLGYIGILVSHRGRVWSIGHGVRFIAWQHVLGFVWRNIHWKFKALYCGKPVAKRRRVTVRASPNPHNNIKTEHLYSHL